VGARGRPGRSRCRPRVAAAGRRPRPATERVHTFEDYNGVCALLEDLLVVFQERDVPVDRGRRRREDTTGNGGRYRKLSAATSSTHCSASSVSSRQGSPQYSSTSTRPFPATPSPACRRAPRGPACRRALPDLRAPWPRPRAPPVRHHHSLQQCSRSRTACGSSPTSAAWRRSTVYGQVSGGTRRHRWGAYPARVAPGLG
jgi:hypothetical protein